jgi:hypothetical protein
LFPGGTGQSRQRATSFHIGNFVPVLVKGEQKAIAIGGKRLLTGAEKLRRAAVYWIERTLDFYRLARTNGTGWVHGSWEPAQPTQWTWTGIELVEGAAGVALVLLAAATSIEPTWDRMFLVSGPTSFTRTPA